MWSLGRDQVEGGGESRRGSEEARCEVAPCRAALLAGGAGVCAVDVPCMRSSAAGSLASLREGNPLRKGERPLSGAGHAHQVQQLLQSSPR
jgi:hypothetical protein